MTDQETISVYDAQADAYKKLVQKESADPILLAFIARIEKNGFVLDLGCGPANSSAIMRDHGLRVDPTDASSEMVKLANETFDIGARQALFSDINEVAVYDGVWASFSLLHASRAEFPIFLTALHHALKADGVLYLGLKLGEGEKRDKIGRLYTYYSEAELRTYLREAGFAVEQVDFREGLGMAGDVEPWIMMTSVKV